MTGKTIAIHSYRGGTGKTVLATNLAVTLANKGSNVALLDMDFRAPSLSIMFAKYLNEPVKYWLNDYLDNRSTAAKTMLEVPQTTLKGKMFLGLADPTIGAVTSIMERSRAWEVSALKKIFSLRNFIFDELNLDYCIFDTSPGVQYSSVNAAVASDICIVVTTLDVLDMDGVKRLLTELYDSVDKKTCVIINKVFPETCPWPENKQKELIRATEASLNHKVLDIIPCYCHVLQAGRIPFISENKPFQPFLNKLDNIVKKIEDALAS